MISLYFENPLLFSNIQYHHWVLLRVIKFLSIVSLVRGSEGLYMVNGPPHFTESTVLPRYSFCQMINKKHTMHSKIFVDIS